MNVVRGTVGRLSGVPAGVVRRERIGARRRLAAVCLRGRPGFGVAEGGGETAFPGDRG
jgi:hypothetical protein